MLGTCLSEPLGEAPACLLKADSLVEGMGVRSAGGCGQEDEAATPPLRLPLHLLHQSLTNPRSAVPLVDDDCAELGCRGVVCDREAGMEAREAGISPSSSATTSLSTSLDHRRSTRSRTASAEVGYPSCAIRATSASASLGYASRILSSTSTKKCRKVRLDPR